MNDILGRIEFNKSDMSNILYEEIDRLKLEIENLKCCGNCRYYYKPTCAKSDKEGVFMAGENEYCEGWKYDELTKEERRDKCNEGEHK